MPQSPPPSTKIDAQTITEGVIADILTLILPAACAAPEMNAAARSQHGKDVAKAQAEAIRRLTTLKASL